MLDADVAESLKMCAYCSYSIQFAEVVGSVHLTCKFNAKKSFEMLSKNPNPNLHYNYKSCCLMETGLLWPLDQK